MFHKNEISLVKPIVTYRTQDLTTKDQLIQILKNWKYLLVFGEMWCIRHCPVNTCVHLVWKGFRIYKEMYIFTLKFITGIFVSFTSVEEFLLDMKKQNPVSITIHSSPATLSQNLDLLEFLKEPGFPLFCFTLWCLLKIIALIFLKQILKCVTTVKIAQYILVQIKEPSPVCGNCSEEEMEDNLMIISFTNGHLFFYWIAKEF